MKSCLPALLILLLAGCAQVTSLNLRKHQFGLLPTKVIWFQVAGLEEEQLAMLRFREASDKRTSFEENLCIGKTWNYNLYDLRASASSTFLSQITGRKNIKGTCEDANLRPIWNYVNPNGYQTAVLESGAGEGQALHGIGRCGEDGLKFLSSLYYFSRSKPPVDAPTFHYSEEIKLAANQVTYDRTCGDSSCGSTLTEDLKAVYARFRRISEKHFLIVRDFSYLRALEAKDFAKAREILVDLETAYGEALKFTASNEYLVLLTTGESKFVDMPDQGTAFFEFEKNNKNVSTKRTKLTNLVLSSGARAENFCGIYEDSQVFERILSGPKQQGLELKIINPFK